MGSGITCTSLSVLVITFTLLFDVCDCKCSDGRERCVWGQWQEWNSCNRSCGGGIQKRLRKQCCKPGLAYDRDACLRDCGLSDTGTERQSCNSFCYNSGTFNSNACHCPDEYYGFCCENECPKISNCKHRSCTSAANVKCTKCEGVYKDLPGQRAYVLTSDKKRCIQACSWRSDSKWCYPGTCENEYASNCECSKGFSGPNCITIDDYPKITYSEFIINKGETNEKSVPKDVNAWPVQNPSWTNVKDILTMEFDFRSSYKPGYTVVPKKHEFLKTYQVGITEGKVDITFSRGSRIQTSFSKEYQCDGASIHNPQKNTLNCTQTIEVANTVPQMLITGDILDLTFKTSNGGFVQVMNLEYGNRITEHRYNGKERQSTVRLGFDFIKPYHCVDQGCNTEVLTVPKVTEKSNPAISWDGWNDDTSGLDYFGVEVFELKHVPSESGLKTGPKVPNENTTSVGKTFTLNLQPTGGLYAVELTAFDKAGNMKTARRIMMFDNTSAVESKENTTLVVTSASLVANYMWQWTTDSVDMEWTGRYYNSRHHNNHWLEKVMPQPDIDHDYDDQGKSRGVDKIPNIEGIVRFETSFRIDHSGGKSLTSPAEFSSVGLNESQVLTPSLVDGDTLRFWIRAFDIRNKYREENVTVHIDTSPPVVKDLWLTRDDRLNISVHRAEELKHMTIEWESYDVHSGLEEVTWRLFDNYTGSEILHGKQHTSSQGDAKDEAECRTKYGNYSRGANCYCTPGVGCYHRHFQVKPVVVHADISHGGIFQNTSTGVHDSDYFLEVTVMNHAKQKTVLTRKITIDVSPPHPGVVHDGRLGQPEVDFQDNKQLHAHWDGFFDEESGVMFYQYKFENHCLQSTDFGYDTDQKKVTETYTTHATWTAPDPGKYHVTVVAYNRALEPSKPVCSDGVTVDTTGPELSEFAVGSSHTAPGVVKTGPDSVWLIDAYRRRTKVQQPSSACRQKATLIPSDQLVLYPMHRHINGSDMTSTSELCHESEAYAVLPTRKFFLSKEHHLYINWTGSDAESGIYNYEVGLMTHLSNEADPDILPYTSTHHHPHFQNYHAGLSEGQQFYIAVKAINNAGMTLTKTVGPIVVHTQSPVFSPSISVALEMNLLVTSWTKDTFKDPAGTHLKYTVAVGSTQGGTELQPYQSLQGGGSCDLSATTLCTSISINSLEWSLHHSYTYYVSVKATNIVGLSTVGTSQPYVHSTRLPSRGVVLDISPVEEQELADTTDLEDSDFQLKTTTLEARWYGFDDGLSDVTYKTCIGSAPGLQDIRAFEDVGSNTTHRFRNLHLEISKRYHVVVVAKTTAGEITASSDGVLILKRNEEIATIRIRDGHRCEESTQHQVPFNTCDASSSYQVSTSLYHGYWNIDHDVLTKYPDVYWRLEKKFHQSADLWHPVGDYELIAPTGKIIAGAQALDPGHTYRASLKFCAVKMCTQPVFSSGITVIPHPPTAGSMVINYTETANTSQIRVVMPSYYDPDIPNRQESHNVMSRYEWSITDNSHHNRLLTGWQTIDNINTDEHNKISFALQLPNRLTFTKCRRLAIRGFNKLGLYTVTSGDIRNCSAYDPKNIEHSIVIDAFGLPNGPKDSGRGIHLHLNDKWPKVDMDYTPYKNVISAVWPTLRHHNYTWALISEDKLTSLPHYKREDIMTIKDPCSIPDVIKCGTTENEYINVVFNGTDYLIHGKRYYVCIHADARDVEFEKWTTRLDEINTCSDGITVDLTPPSTGTVTVQGLVEGKYQVSKTEVIVHWNGFTDVEEEGTSTHTSGISNYQVAVGSFPEGEDIQTFTDVGCVNHTVVSGLSLHDGNTVYVTVKATDFVNNSVSVSSSPFIIDTTPPLRSSRQILIDSRYVTSSVVSACWNGVLTDGESGIKSYSVSLGSRPGYDDIVTSVSTSETCMVFDLESKVEDGHSFYINIKGINGIGQHSTVSSRKLIVDTTPPSVGAVYDGAFGAQNGNVKDKDYVRSISEMGAHWEGFRDPHSSIKYFKVKVGTCAGCDDVVKEYNAGAVTYVEFLAKYPRFVKGVRYFTTTTCCNMADLCVSATSDGILIDSSIPIPGTLIDGIKDEDIQYQASRTFLGCKWRDFQDPESGVDYYEWRVGTSPYTDDILSSRSVALSGVAYTTLPANEKLPVGQLIYCTIKAVNRAGLYSEVTSNGFVVDDTSPSVVSSPRLAGHGSLLTNTLISRSVIKVKWEFKDEESHIEKQYLSISSHQLGQFDSSLLEVPGFLQEYTFTKLDLHDGSKYKVKVTACNMASLCTSSYSEDIFVDSSKPVAGTFAVKTDHAAALTRHQPGWMTWTDTSISLAWLGFADLHSGIDHYVVTVGSAPFQTDLNKNLLGTRFNHNNETGMDQEDEGLVQTHVVKTEHLSGHRSVFVAIWAINGVGLESHPLHGELHLGSGGQLELVRRCSNYNCEGHCVCAAQDQTCTRRKGCSQIDDLDRLEVYDVDRLDTGASTVDVDFTPSLTFLAATWRVVNSRFPPIRYEYSVGDSQFDEPKNVLSETERLWFDAGRKTSAVFEFERGNNLHRGNKYSFFVRAWYNSTTYGIFKSDGVTIDADAPSLTNKKGKAVKEHRDEISTKDVDYQPFTDRMYISWNNKFISGDSEIAKYRVYISTTPGGHSIHESEDVTVTNYTAVNLNLQPDTVYYTSVLVYDKAGLVSWAYSDGVEVDLSAPHAGLVQDGRGLHDEDFQASGRDVSATWHGFSDNALVNYKWCVGTSNDTTDCDIVDWENVGLHTSFKRHLPTDIAPGTKLWSKVYAIDAVGHRSDVVVSDGVTVDTTPPEAVDIVYLGENLVSNPSFEEHPLTDVNQTDCNKILLSYWEPNRDSCVTVKTSDTPLAKHGMSFVSVQGSMKQTIRNLQQADRYVVTVHTGYPQAVTTKHRALEGFVSFGAARFTFSLDPHLCLGNCGAEGQVAVVWSTHTYTIEAESEASELVIGTVTRDMEMVVDHISVQSVQYTSHSDAVERRDHINVQSVFLPHWSSVHFTWHFVDNESPITEYAWALGTVKQGTQIQPFVNTGRHNHGTLNGLHLTHKQKLYLTVTATNAAGLTTVSHPDPVTVDFTPPMFKWIHDGERGTDLDYQESRTITVSWLAEDAESEITHCDWAVGTIQGTGNTKQFERVEAGRSSGTFNLSSNLDSKRVTLFSTVRCSNRAGLMSMAVSDGVMVSSARETQASEVELLDENSLLYHTKGQCHTEEALRLKWSRQEHLHNVMQIKDTKTIYQEKVPSHFEYAKLCGFKFDNLSTYSLAVYPESMGGIKGLVSLHNFTFHAGPPQARASQTIRATRSQNRVTLSWSDLFSSPWENLQYEVKAGSVRGGADLVEGMTTRTPQLDLMVDKPDGTEVHVTITATDSCGYSTHYNEKMEL